MRTLEKHAFILKYVVAYRCSECGREFKVNVKKHLTGNTSGPPTDVLDAFEKHECSETTEANKAK